MNKEHYIKILEICGWTELTWYPNERLGGRNLKDIRPGEHTTPPDLLNAIYNAEELLTLHQRKLYVSYLRVHSITAFRVCSNRLLDNFDMIHNTDARAGCLVLVFANLQ